MSIATYPIINNVSCAPNVEVKFQTFSRKESQTWRGIIMGTAVFDIARNFADVVAIHEDMEADIARKEVTVETFLLIKTADGAIRPFAISWINSNTFARTDNLSDVTVVIHNITTTAAFRIMNYIRDQGYNCTQV